MKFIYPLFFFVLFFLEVYSVLPSISSDPLCSSESPLENRTCLKGAIHVHSTFSDGGGTPDEIIQAGQKTNYDFIVLTDHNTVAARNQFEKQHVSNNTISQNLPSIQLSPLDLFVEMEAATASGHAHAFFSRSTLRDSNTEAIIQFTHRQATKTDSLPDFFSIIAHPSNLKNPWTRLDRYGDGIEIMNFDSVWQEQVSNSTLSFLMTLFTFPFNQFVAALRFLTPNYKDLELWDALISKGPGTVGILAHDTHAKLILSKNWILKWPTYFQVFKLASNRILLKEPIPKSASFTDRKAAIYSAVQKGQLAVNFDPVFPFSGHSWKLKCSGTDYISGDTVNITSGNHASCEFTFSFPETFPHTRQIKLLRDGKVLNEVWTTEPTLNLPISGPGSYRAEIWIKRHSLFRLLLNRMIPVVFYNPIWVK